MSSAPVSAVVVAYHAPEALDRCLGAIRGEFALTVIDNSSSSEVEAVVRGHACAYVDPGRNTGFAGAVNLALARRRAEGGDALLLNPDAVITPEAIHVLHTFLHAPGNARLAAVAPILVMSDGSPQRVQWPYPSPARMCAEAVGLGRVPGRDHFVIGAVLLLRREALEDVGPFDERFFLYAEEADWQRRALVRGWASAVCPDAIAEHAVAGTSSSERTREQLFHAAQELYIRKWYGATGWSAYRTAACCGAAARAVVLTGERRRHAARRMCLYLRGPVRVGALGTD